MTSSLLARRSGDAGPAGGERWRAVLAPSYGVVAFPSLHDLPRPPSARSSIPLLSSCHTACLLPKSGAPIRARHQSARYSNDAARDGCCPNASSRSTLVGGAFSRTNCGGALCRVSFLRSTAAVLVFVALCIRVAAIQRSISGPACDGGAVLHVKARWQETAEIVSPTDRV